MDRIAVETTSVVVLAEGSSPSDIANRRGHLLEEFMAKLLATQGYGEPRREDLNVTSEGVEIDIVARHNVTRHKLLCECKVYSSNIRVPAITSFLGKFALARADNERCEGIFVGFPRLTAEAKEKAEAAEAKLRGFRYLGSFEVCELLARAHFLPRMDDGPRLAADPTLVIAEHGLALAARELDSDTRRPFRMVVWNTSGQVPSALLRLVERELAEGLPVTPSGSDPNVLPVIRIAAEPTIVDVKGSTSDFEYQLPAAPAFFVGRKALAAELTRRICGSGAASVFVINAKSGWGKSSLSLLLRREVEKRGGVAMVVDTRTAERPEFVTVAFEKVVRTAADQGVISLPASAAFSSARSIVETLRAAKWADKAKPILLIFDQFENVFRSYGLTKEFRNLAFIVKDLEVPLTVGFSWKTDMVGWTEGHPYHLRDEIREVAHVTVLAPFGPRETETLLRRLERVVKAKFQPEFRQRLREYSQGLPWLFKKLAGHIISEISRGVTQEQLLRESLNAQVLFENDLARLAPAEQEALRIVARAAPVLVSELDDEAIPGAVLESLLHQRLVVQVGDRLDIYWDTFRDFLITGRVAIEDSYVVRYSPIGAGRLLRVILGVGGNIAVPSAAEQLNTSPMVVFNYARELRLFGVLTAESNRLVLEPAIVSSAEPEEAIRARVLQALRKHKMHTLAMGMLAPSEMGLPISRLAEALPREFPTVEAKADSWLTYARSFAQWMEYAGLIDLGREGMVRRSEVDTSSRVRLLSGVKPVRIRSTFPGSGPGPAVRLLKYLVSPTTEARPPKSGFEAAVRDLTLLDAVVREANGRILLTGASLMSSEGVDAACLRTLVERQRGMTQAFARLEADPACPPRALGELHKKELGADWAESTTISVGKYIRAWARICGISTQLRKSAD